MYAAVLVLLQACLLLSARTNGAAKQIQDHSLSVPLATVHIFKKKKVNGSLQQRMAGLSAPCTCMCLLLLSSSTLWSGQYSLLAVQLNGHLYIVPMKCCWDDWGWTVILNINSPLVHWTIQKVTTDRVNTYITAKIVIVILLMLTMGHGRKQIVMLAIIYQHFFCYQINSWMD